MPASADQALQVGRAWPLGAQVLAGGVNFVVASSHATAIELCLFDKRGQQELQRLPLPGRSADLWHGFLPGAGPDLVYGLRAHGPWRPDRGHRFNPNKLLLDPWAREIVGRFESGPQHCGAEALHAHHKDRIDNGALQDLTLDAQGRFSITTALELDGSADGTHTISLIARDVAGDLTPATVRTFTLDTQAPALTLSSLADGAK